MFEGEGEGEQNYRIKKCFAIYIDKHENSYDDLDFVWTNGFVEWFKYAI